jgi:FixJ family two-component response regulator
MDVNWGQSRDGRACQFQKRYSVDMRSSTELLLAANSLVVVVDDDSEFRASVGLLLRSVGLNVRLFASIAEYLAAEPADVPTCLVLDIMLPGRSGLDFQCDLVEANIESSIIFMTAHGDIPMTVRAMKGGAIEFLTKPFRDQDLLEAVYIGLDRDRARREVQGTVSALRARFEALTRRERTVMIEVAQGRLNKQIASAMGITENTVKVHRSNMMRKMGVVSVAELCRLVDKLDRVAQNPQLRPNTSNIRND